MSRMSFVFTICFVLIGPIKIIPAFGAAVKSIEPRLRRRVAILATLLATATCALVVGAGRSMLGKYEISLAALQLGGGLVLLISALRAIFPPSEPPPQVQQDRSLWQIAISPLVTPVIVAPAGIAALLIFVMIAPRYPGMYTALAIVLPIILALDFLVMYFNDRIVRLPALMLALQLLGAVLIFIQVALAAETIVDGLRTLGVVAAGSGA